MNSSMAPSNAIVH